MHNESDSHFTEDAKELLAHLGKANRVLIGTHLNPDGDAIGSALAVSLMLEQLGIANDVVCHNLPPGYLSFLPGSDRVRTSPPRHDYDLAMVLDLDALDRLGSCRASFESVPFLILIDHHQPHEMPGNLRIVDPSAPATASILLHLFLAIESLDSRFSVNSEIAECLLTGLVTDTGSFRYPNASASSLRQAAWLVDKGATLSKVTDEVYLNRDEQAIFLLREALNQMKIGCQGQLAWAVLTPEMFQKVSALEEHAEGIVNELLSNKNVKASFVLRSGKFGKVKGSLRSKGDLDVSKVAQSIGGGGHKNASGVTIEGTLQDAEAIVVKALSEALGC